LPMFKRGLKLGAQATRSGEFMPSGEINLLTRSGTLVPVYSIHTVVCLECTDPIMFCIDVDLRERKKVEEELKNYRDHLEKLVEERTAELTNVNLQLHEEIQERLRTEVALRESEAQFRTVFEGAPVGVSLISLDWEFIDINLAFMEMLGFNLGELRQIGFANIVHPEDLATARSHFQAMKNGERDFYQREGRYRRQDGSWMWGQVNVSAIRDEAGKLLFAVSMLVDITLEKAAQAEISAYQERLRALASELSLTEERERRLLAADLHDHIGQILALAQIKLGAMRQEASSPEAQAAVTEVRDYIGQAIRYTRSLTYELGLPILYDLGLEAALEWLAEQMHEQLGLTVQVHRDQQAKPLGEAARVLVFRVVRELLTNVVKHAKATKVDITIAKHGSCMHIKVEDDGVGFDLAESTPRSGKSSGYGLFSIRERLTSLGGVVKIRSLPGQGTRISITVPLDQQEAIMN
jgi:PAS domain S-box-containing protein